MTTHQKFTIYLMHFICFGIIVFFMSKNWLTTIVMAGVLSWGFGGTYIKQKMQNNPPMNNHKHTTK
jgi:hypothetical protein